MSETIISPKPRNIRMSTSAISAYDMQLTTPIEPAIAVSTAINTLSNLPQSKFFDIMY